MRRPHSNLCALCMQSDASGAERADRALCLLVCAGTSTRRAPWHMVSHPARIVLPPSSRVRRAHASCALALRPLIGAAVNSRFSSSSASSASAEAATAAPLRADQRETAGARILRAAGVCVRACCAGLRGTDAHRGRWSGHGNTVAARPEAAACRTAHGPRLGSSCRAEGRTEA